MISLLLYHAGDRADQSNLSIIFTTTGPFSLSLFRLSAKPVSPQFTHFVLFLLMDDFAFNVTALGMQEAPMPRCLCLQAGPSIPIIPIKHNHSAPRGGMVQGCVPAPGGDARLGAVWVTPPSPCCAALV